MNKELLLAIAKKTIENKFNNKEQLNKETLLKKNPFLKENKATFVTLYLNNELRGCIGTLQAYRSLYDDLVSNAYMAAFEDPRFYELSYEEFLKVELEISILSTPNELFYTDFDDLKSKLKVGIDGMILEFDGRRSTFLPQVWEQLPIFEDFFAHLCHKGGFEVDDKFLPKVYTYQVQKIK